MFPTTSCGVPLVMSIWLTVPALATELVTVVAVAQSVAVDRQLVGAVGAAGCRYCPCRSR